MVTGGEAERIVLWPLGGYVLLGRTEGLNICEDFWVALAGPLTHIPQAAAWYGISLIFNSYDYYDFDADASWDFDELKSVKGFITTLCEEAIFLNAALFVFNLFVPAYPLDGGRILASLCVMCCCKVTAAAYFTSLVALLLAGCMAAWALYDLFLDEGADGGSPLFLLLIAAWIGLNAFNLLRMAMAGKALEHALFNKECYRRADGVDSSSDAAERRIEMQARKKEEKEAKKRNKKKGRNSGHEPEEQEEEEEGPSARFQGNNWVEETPQPDSPALSPAGAGTSWSTLNTHEPPPPMTPPDAEPEKKRGGLGRMFGRKSSSKPADADDWVV